MPRLGILKAILFDSFTLVATGTTLYQACTHTGLNGRSVFALFAFPSLPVAIIGLLFLLASCTKMHGALLFWLIAALLLITGTAISLLLWKFRSNEDQGLSWYVSTIFFAYMTLPLGVCNHPAAAFAGNAIAMFARVGGVGFAALSDRVDFPYCGLQSKAFGVVYLTVGAVAALLSMFGAIYHAQKRPTGDNPVRLEEWEPQVTR
jgi:hypothetical protein